MTTARIRSWVCPTFGRYPQRAGLACLTSPLVPALTTRPGFHPGQNRTFLELWFFVVTDQTQDKSGIFRKWNYFSAPGHVFTVSLSFRMKGANIKAFSAAFY